MLLKLFLVNILCNLVAHAMDSLLLRVTGKKVKGGGREGRYLFLLHSSAAAAAAAGCITCQSTRSEFSLPHVHPDQSRDQIVYPCFLSRDHRSLSSNSALLLGRNFTLFVLEYSQF